jgi:Na+/pantothenate symporter
MLIAIQIITIAGMLFLTFVAFQAFGGRRGSLLFSKEDKEKWDQSISKAIGGWFTITNIVGTLTSLATAYLFFIGSSKLFGWVALMCCLSIWVGAFITNAFTSRILQQDYLKSLLEKKAQSAGVIATLFWRSDNENARTTAALVKWLSLFNIVAVIWLEFAIFSDLASKLFSVNALWGKVIFILTATFIVMLFTTKYGLRGFVFADAFQSPIIAISAIGLLIGSIYLFTNIKVNISLADFIKPILTTKECIIFSAHVLFLNGFFVLVTEGHWLRIWIFGRREQDLQVKSLVSTATIWLFLICIGLFTFFISGKKVGLDAIISLVNDLGNVSPIFLVLFWLGGIAALFSTADAQLYSLFLVKDFNVNTGQLNNRLLNQTNPIKFSFLFALFFCIFYFLVRYFQIPFEKIVFIIMPICLNLLPAFIRAFKKFEQKPYLVILSSVLYLICSTVGFFKPSEELTWTLAAALMPALFSLIALKK